MYETRAGNAKKIKMEKKEIESEIEDGTNEAAENAGIEALTEDEQEHLLDIIIESGGLVSVDDGDEIVLTRDGGTIRYTECNRYQGIPLSKEQAVWMAERILFMDTMELGHLDYSFKRVKPVAHDEAAILENTMMLTIIPILYGSMPNLGLYYQSQGGSFPTPTDLMKEGKFEEAKETQENAKEKMLEDMRYIGKVLAKTGLDGLNIDTAAAAGDAEFYGVLEAVEYYTQELGIPVEVGMSTEEVLGMHAELEYEGTKLAGITPHKQGKLLQKAGASIFGPAINVNSEKTFPWNLARAITYVKKCTEELEIPIHPNMGMSVGGVPVTDTPPVDAVSRAAKAMVEIANIDGI
ncbi:hypothetical protein AKJ49_00390 [candidate division MSBL1 archaeon SCGC-AAA382A03]|uniref:[dimethylamine--corrinoid protein] Co-methyltransferase n=1 Tax=candidate division MSBL1 archaeon SCGC-AAA382A03 TaxID=1698278 RepID=A0A133VGU6_9EURY|nr:hypothetical protein AKJ49_00390 [candidate division MSBL1 archaeon SCGC-AAA382A03]